MDKVELRGCLKSGVQALKGQNSIAGGNATGRDGRMVSTLKGSHRALLCNPFRVGMNLVTFPWALPTAINCVPFGDQSTTFISLLRQPLKDCVLKYAQSPEARAFRNFTLNRCMKPAVKSNQTPARCLPLKAESNLLWRHVL
jgi:hypothetical protein